MAAAETRRIGEAQVRAYVDIVSAEIAFGALGILNLERDAHPTISFAAKNTGQSPARNFVWNPTIQYIASGEGQIRRRIGELGGNWNDILGVNIPVGGPHSDRAMISNMNLNQFMPQLDGSNFPASQTVFVRLRIEFGFEDVFDNKILGDAYFAGLFSRQTLNGVHEPTDWSGTLSRMHKPSEWPELPNRTGE